MATIVIYAPAHTTVPRELCYHENDNGNANDNDSLINVGAAIIQQAMQLNVLSLCVYVWGQEMSKYKQNMSANFVHAYTLVPTAGLTHRQTDRLLSQCCITFVSFIML